MLRVDHGRVTLAGDVLEERARGAYPQWGEHRHNRGGLKTPVFGSGVLSFRPVLSRARRRLRKESVHRSRGGVWVDYPPTGPHSRRTPGTGSLTLRPLMPLGPGGPSAPGSPGTPWKRTSKQHMKLWNGTSSRGSLGRLDHTSQGSQAAHFDEPSHWVTSAHTSLADAASAY